MKIEVTDLKNLRIVFNLRNINNILIFRKFRFFCGIFGKTMYPINSKPINSESATSNNTKKNALYYNYVFLQKKTKIENKIKKKI